MELLDIVRNKRGSNYMTVYVKDAGPLSGLSKNEGVMIE